MTIKLRSAIEGEYIVTSVFIGEDADHLTNAGQLRLYPSEWAVFEPALLIAGIAIPHKLAVSATYEGGITPEEFCERIARMR